MYIYRAAAAGDVRPIIACRLRQIDIHFMKRLHHKVNIVPVIAKADTLTRAEIRKMKAHILDQISNNDIHIYEFPDCDSDEDEDFKKQDQELKVRVRVYARV